MQTSQIPSTYEPPDLQTRERFAYYRWMRREGIPIHFDVAGTSDITAVTRAPWARTGKGLGVFLELTGTYQAERGMFVCEIPPGESLDVQHHLYEQFTLILQGQGATEVWQKDGPKRVFEWSKGSLFAPPKNTYYRMYNLGQEPVLNFGVTTASKLMNGMFAGWGNNLGRETGTSPLEAVFNCDYNFAEQYDGREDYFARTDNREVSGRYNASIWYTNFIPNVFDEDVEDLEQKVAGGQLTGYRMAGGFPSGHISEWPKGAVPQGALPRPGRAPARSQRERLRKPVAQVPWRPSLAGRSRG